MTPKKLEIHAKAYMHRQKSVDENMWRMGAYVNNAVVVAIDHALNGHKAKSKYLEKPLCADMFEDETLPKNKESKEQCAVFEMKQRIRQLQLQGLQESPS